MIVKDKAIHEIVTRYFNEPDKSLEEIFGEYVVDLPQEDADKVINMLKEIIN